MLSYCQLKQQQAQLTVVKEKIPMDNFQVSHRYQTICTNMLGMIATCDGRLLLCNFSGEQGGVVVYGENGKYIKKVTLKDAPFDIAFIPRIDQYVVTLPVINSIQFINKDFTLDKCVKVKYTNQDKCTNYLYGVTTSHQYIYICENMQILVLNFSGIGLREISINGIGCIWYISVGNDSKLYVADAAGDLFSVEGETGKLKQFTSPVNRCSLGKIVMDTSGNMYSPDRVSNCVCKLSSDLKLTKIITDSNFNEIYAICFNKNCSKLFVANNRGKSIIVFNCT